MSKDKSTPMKQLVTDVNSTPKKSSIFNGKVTRTKAFSVITIVGIAVLLTLNLLLALLGSKRLMMVDLTSEGFYTLSDKMVEVCHEILDAKDGEEEKQIKITFCTDPDYLIESDAMRATYFMALALQKKFDNVEVTAVNVINDPTAVAMYRTTSRETISSSDVIFSYGSKYRVVDATGFWTKDNFSYNGEYRVASILASLTAINRPVAYFVSEYYTSTPADKYTEYYDPDNENAPYNIELASFADLLTERGLEIRTLNLNECKEIPEDCALLIINNPAVDFDYDASKLDDFYYVSDLEKLDRYMLRESAAIIINKDYSVSLPRLENFCKEWGIGYGNNPVYDPENALFTSLTGESDDSVFAGKYDANEENFGYAYYGGYSSLSSAPKMVFSNTGYLYCTIDMGDAVGEAGNQYASKNYAPFIGTSSDAYHVYYEDGVAKKVTGEKTLVAASVRTNLDPITSEKTTAYLFCMNSKDFFSNELLSNASYANYDILASVITNVSRTDRFATMELGGMSYNSPSFGGKQTLSTTLSESPTKIYSWDATEVLKYNAGFSRGAAITFTVIIMLAPVAALSLGAVVFIKRKFL